MLSERGDVRYIRHNGDEENGPQAPAVIPIGMHVPGRDERRLAAEGSPERRTTAAVQSVAALLMLQGGTAC